MMVSARENCICHTPVYVSDLDQNIHVFSYNKSQQTKDTDRNCGLFIKESLCLGENVNWMSRGSLLSSLEPSLDENLITVMTSNGSLYVLGKFDFKNLKLYSKDGKIRKNNLSKLNHIKSYAKMRFLAKMEASWNANDSNKANGGPYTRRDFELIDGIFEPMKYVDNQPLIEQLVDQAKLIELKQ